MTCYRLELAERSIYDESHNKALVFFLCGIPATKPPTLVFHRIPDQPIPTTLNIGKMAHHDMKDFAASVVTLEAEAEAMEKIMDMYAAKIEKIIEAGALREWEGAIEEVLDFSHDPFDLSRFVEAQSARRSGYATALTEIKAGRKQSHWSTYFSILLL